MAVSKIKILFLHTGAELYGSDRVLLSIVSGLDRNLFEPIVVLPSDGPLVYELKKKNIRVRIIPYPIIRRKFFNLRGIVRYLSEYRKACKILIDIAKREKVQVIHNNTIAVLEGIYLRKRMNVALVTHVHEMISKPTIVAAFLYKIQLKYADEILCVSNAVAKHVGRYSGKSSRNIVVVHNGIRAVRKSRISVRPELDIPEDAKLFAIIGRINAIKGQDDFVEAIKLARTTDRNVYGIIVGDAFSGQKWRINALRKKIDEEELSKYIKYIGFRKDLSSIYSSIDALILSSVRNDSFPTVVLEAMSCGVPTIAYKCGGVEEMISDGTNGFLVESRDVKALSDRMIHINNIVFNKSVFEIFQKNFSLKLFIEKIQREYIRMVSMGMNEEK